MFASRYDAVSVREKQELGLARAPAPTLSLTVYSHDVAHVRTKLGLNRKGFHNALLRMTISCAAPGVVLISEQ
jgi:hypothetical protein